MSGHWPLHVQRNQPSMVSEMIISLKSCLTTKTNELNILDIKGKCVGELFT